MTTDGWTPRKVAHLTTVDLSLRHLLYAQLHAVLERGAECIGISAPGPDVPWLEEHGIRHVPLDGSTRSFDLRADLRAARSLWHILRQERPDVLHTHNPKPGVYGRVVGRLAGVPVVVNTVHGLYATSGDAAPKRAVVYLLEAFASRFSDAELIQNRDDHELLCRWHVSAPDKTMLLGNGVDIERFRPPSADERSDARAALGIVDDQVVVGFVGRLVAEKGLPELLEVHRRLQGRFRLIVVGPHDPAKPDAVSEASVAQARRDGVTFTGLRDDVEHLYRAFDVLCLPSHREGFPRTPMEAAASGVPAVVTDVRGCREAVADGVTGVLVPVRDVDALAAAIERLLDPATRQKLASAARAHAVLAFDERGVVERVDAAYRAAHQRRVHRSDRVKRATDLVGATIGLIAAAPVLAIAAVVVRLALGSPVLFRQVRPGRDSKPFTIFKLRTMSDATGADGTTLPDEDRLGRVGRVLRATSIDEVPELWNVLRGDMSLVGPRPLLVEYLERYDGRQARRHEVRPGLTGLAQVNGRNLQSWEERLDMDVDYVDRRSFRLDIGIMLTTALHVALRRGVAEEGVATRTEFRGDVGQLDDRA